MLEVLHGVSCKPSCRGDAALCRCIERAVQKMLGLLHVQCGRSKGICIVEVSGRAGGEAGVSAVRPFAAALNARSSKYSLRKPKKRCGDVRTGWYAK